MDKGTAPTPVPFWPYNTGCNVAATTATAGANADGVLIATKTHNISEFAMNKENFLLVVCIQKFSGTFGAKTPKNNGRDL